MADRKLNIIYGANADQAVKETRRLQRETRKAQREISNDLKAISTAFVGMTTVFTGVSVKAALEIDDIKDNIRVMTGAAGAELKSLEDSFSKLATSVPSSLEDVGNGLSVVNREFGLTGEAAETLAAQITNMSRLLGVDVVGAGNGFSKVVGAWGIEARDSAGYLDLLYSVAAKTGLPFEKLTTFLSANQGALQGMGFSAEQAALLVGQLETQGFKIGKTIDGVMGKAITSGNVSLEAMRLLLGDTSGAIQQATVDTSGFSENMQMTMNAAALAVEPLGVAILDLANDMLPSLTESLKDVTAEDVKFYGGLAIAGATITTVAGVALKLVEVLKNLNLLMGGSLLSKLGKFAGVAGLFITGYQSVDAIAKAAGIKKSDVAVPTIASMAREAGGLTKPLELPAAEQDDSGINTTSDFKFEIPDVITPLTPTNKKTGGSGKKKTAELSAREEALKRLTDEQKKLNREEQIGIEIESILQERMGHTNESMALASDIANEYSNIWAGLNEKARVWTETWKGDTSIADYLGFGEGEREAASEIANSYEEIWASMSPLNEEAQKLQENISKMGENSIDLSAALSSWQSDLAGSFAQAIANGENLGDVLQGLLKDIGTLILKSMILNAISGIFGGGKSGWTSVGGIPMHADGAAFVGGRVSPFARGGVVTAPTLFPMASGAGLMGEAGPEAVMPLERIGGKLGVHADISGGGDAPNVTVQVINQSGTPLGASRQSVTKDPVSKDWVVSVIVNDINNGGAVRSAIKRG